MLVVSEDHTNDRLRFPVPNKEGLSHRVAQTTGHQLQELVPGQVIGPRQPWPIDVHLGLLVVGLVVGSHPGRINLINLNSVYFELRNGKIAIVVV